MSTKTFIGALLEKQIPPMGTIPEFLLDACASFAQFRGGFSKLSKVERVLAAFRHREADQVPLATIVCAAGRQVSGISFPNFSLDPDMAAKAFLEGYSFVGGEVVILLLDLSIEAADLGQKLVIPQNSTARPDYDRPFLASADDYGNICAVDVKNAPRMSNYIKLCRKVVRGVGFSGIVSGFIYGPLGVLAMMRGADYLFKDCMLYPDKVKKACEIVTPVLLEFAQAQCEAGVGAIAIDTLFASANALPKKVWEDIEGPFAGQIARAIKKNGVIAGIHNCGHDLYFNSQIRFMEPSFISFAHLPDDCKTRKELKEKYGSALTLVGHVPTPLLIHGTPEQVMEECYRQMDDLAAGGGFILAPGCEYPPNIPLTNAIAMNMATGKYGRNYRKPGRSIPIAQH